MSIDDQLKQIKLHDGKSLYEVQQQRSRLTALFLAGAVCISLIACVFAFVQKTAADNAREEALKNQKEAFQQESLAKRLRDELAICNAAK